MELDPRRLSVLLAVHRAGGVLAGAEQLHLTPSAVSQQIAKLESETGVRVLDRHPTGARLTPAGKVLAEAAERIEAELAEARRLVSAHAAEVAGTVIVGAFQTAIRAIVVPLLGTLAQTMPGVHVMVREVDAERGQRALRSGELDLLILEHDAAHHPPAPRGTRDVPFLDEPWQAVLPDTVPAPTTLVDLNQYTWLGVNPNSAAGRAVQRVTAHLGMQPSTAHQYDDYDVAIAMVAAGFGITMLPWLAAQRHLPSGVQVVPVPGLGHRRLVVRHRIARQDPRPELLAVLDAIVAAAAELNLDVPAAPSAAEQ